MTFLIAREQQGAIAPNTELKAFTIAVDMEDELKERTSFTAAVEL